MPEVFGWLLVLNQNPNGLLLFRDELATVAGASHAPAALWAAANVRNVTTHARRADISQVWTQ